MTVKKTVNLAIPTDLARRFDAICGQFGHGKQKGMVLGAAILMFLAAPPPRQGEYVKRLAVADIDLGVRRLQAQPALARPALRRAAKQVAPDAVRGMSRLPKPSGGS